MRDLTLNTTLPLRLRKKLGKRLKIENDFPFTQPVFEYLYHGTTGAHLDNKVYLYGLHEAATIRLLRRILRTQAKQGIKPVYWDVGTNSGLHLLATCGLCEQAYGFEPYDKIRLQAEHNLQANAITNTYIFEFGLSDQNTELNFKPPENNNLGVGHFTEEKTSPLTLPVKRGDDLAGDTALPPSLIKLDIEGHEKQALQGLRDTIEKHQPAIIFEYSAASRADFADEQNRKELFPGSYSFHGILRSREQPKLKPFNPRKKYENILAWPQESL